jgi:type II secretory pathway pseudopilin PulG
MDPGGKYFKEQSKALNRLEKGFTYIETLFAIFILAIGCLALSHLFFSGIQINARTKDDTEIATTAQRYLERLYQQGYDQLATGVGGSLTTAVVDFSALGIQLEDSPTVSNPLQFHPNEVRYDIYWQIAHCGNTNPTDVCTNAQLIAGKPWVEISVRVVDNRLEMGAKGREVTVRAQVTQII